MEKTQQKRVVILGLIDDDVRVCPQTRGTVRLTVRIVLREDLEDPEEQITIRRTETKGLPLLTHIRQHVSVFP
jgi:hypothetical protein